MEDVHRVNEFICHTPLSDPYRMDYLQFDSWQGQSIFLFFKTSRQAVGLIQSPLQWILGFFFFHGQELVELCHCSLLYAFLVWTETILTFTPLIKLSIVPNLVRQAESGIILWSSSCFQFPRSPSSVCWVGCYEWLRNASSFKASTPSLCTQVWQAVNRRGWTSQQWHGGTYILTVVCDMLK